MIRRIVAVLLVFLLVLAGGALTAAQSDDASKTIPGRMFGSMARDRSWFFIGWHTPEKEPHSYRVSWKTGERWRSIKKPNTERAGNMIVPGHINYMLKGLRLPDGILQLDRKLRVRVRAIYKGEKNGPWNCCFTVSPPANDC